MLHSFAMISLLSYLVQILQAFIISSGLVNCLIGVFLIDFEILL